MVQSGNPNIPGVTSDITTADSVASQNEAPGDGGVIGEYDATNGTATVNTVYAMTRVTDARERFGEEADSPLARAVIDALHDGLAPVYALAPAVNTVSGEDISAGGDSGTLANTGVSENEATVTFTIDSTVKTTIKTYEAPSVGNIPEGEAHYNPSTGEYALDASPATSATVDYDYVDYNAGIDAYMNDMDAISVVDFLASTTENETVTTYLAAAVDTAAVGKDRMIALAGAAAHMDIATYANPHDTSRLQVVYPPREPENMETVIGSYLALRARMGIEQSPLNKRLRGYRKVSLRIGEGDQEALANENVVSLISESRGVRVANDKTCVADTNTEEAGMSYGLARLVMDTVADELEAIEDNYVGKFNNPRVLSDLENALTGRLQFLLESEVLLNFNITVSKVDAMSAQVDTGVDVVAPLTNVFNTISAGSQ